MGTIFLSHSSADKQFVRRLALDLLQAGFNVWFDETNLGVGNKLAPAIQKGIDTASHVIVVLSSHLVGSKWVDQELVWALDVETRSGREILIPLRIDDADVPERLNDRLYADFAAGSYSEQLSILIERLRLEHADAVTTDDGAGPDPLIPLFAYSAVDLDSSRLAARVRAMCAAPPNGPDSIGPHQFRMFEEPTYRTLRTRMFARLDTIADDPFYTPAFAASLRSFVESVTRHEKALLVNLASLSTALCRADISELVFTEAAEWYWRLERTYIVGWMWNTQRPAGDVLEFGRALFQRASALDFVAAVYGVERTVPVHLIVPDERGSVYSAGVDPASDIGRQFSTEMYVWPEPLQLVHDQDLVSKWLIPQILFYGDGAPIAWRLLPRSQIGLR
ncbi:toll/interleukin-1 receptor domain-containing protein [Jatrophihabitans sp. YIM 134969]